jgi:SAM-dependent methyltransferase
LVCAGCGQRYPIHKGTPILFPDGSFPAIEHEAQMVSLGTYYPWVHRLVLQSLLDHQVVIEIGAGECAVDDPCIIRTDVRWTPHIDVVCDTHNLPFKDQSADFIFSLAVFEHLRQPFVAAEEIRRVLKDGGYCYHECNFVFAYHGYPHHYFNASMQGMEQIFSRYATLRTGISPYQMPSFTLEMVLLTYYRRMKDVPEAVPFRKILESIINDNLIDYDRYFTEEDAAYVAAGTFFFGMRQDHPKSTVIPDIFIDRWNSDAALQAAIRDWRDLGRKDNLLLWGKGSGGTTDAGIQQALAAFEPFQKRPGMSLERDIIRSLAITEPTYGTIWDFPEAAPPRKTVPPPQPPPSRDLRTRLERAWQVLAGNL